MTFDSLRLRWRPALKSTDFFCFFCLRGGGCGCVSLHSEVERCLLFFKAEADLREASVEGWKNTKHIHKYFFFSNLTHKEILHITKIIKRHMVRLEWHSYFFSLDIGHFIMHVSRILFWQFLTFLELYVWP